MPFDSIAIYIYIDNIPIRVKNSMVFDILYMFFTWPSLYHTNVGVGIARASHSSVRVLLTFIFTSLGNRLTPGMSFLLITGGTAGKERI